MAKKIGIIAALCCVFALCFTLIGCGGVDKKNYTGEWKLAYGSDENLDAESIQLMESLGLSVTLTLNEDGSGKLSLFGETSDIKWSASSNTEGKITIDNSDADVKLANGELTLVDKSGSSMTFKKV